MTKEMGLQTFF